MDLCTNIPPHLSSGVFTLFVVVFVVCTFPNNNYIRIHFLFQNYMLTSVKPCTTLTSFYSFYFFCSKLCNFFQINTKNKPSSESWIPGSKHFNDHREITGPNLLQLLKNCFQFCYKIIRFDTYQGDDHNTSGYTKHFTLTTMFIFV